MKKLIVFSLVLVLMMTTVSAALLNEFTQSELDTNWEADRQFPSGGVESVSFDERDNVAKIGVIAAERTTDSFRHFEGIKKVGDYGPHVQVDLYVPSEWQDADVVNVGFWASDDPITSYPIIVYRNSEAVEAGFYTWTYDWDAAAWGYVLSEVEVNYDGWNTLSMTLSETENLANYFINSIETGSVYNAGDYIGQVFLNHYNDGVRDYSAHWHVGLPDYRAAPAVAADLLKAAEISPRYGQGRNGGNHIADVANFMGDGTDFNDVLKEDVVAYECEVVKYLRSKDVPAMVTSSSECYEFIETVIVDSANVDGASSELTLLEGVDYYLVSSGTWTNRPGETVDTKYVTMDDWATYTDAPTGGYPAELLELQVDELFVDWGAYSEEHIYTLVYTGSDSPVSFRVFDGDVATNSSIASWYGDNVGSLYVDIYAKLW